MKQKKIGYQHQKYWNAKNYSDFGHIRPINRLLRRYRRMARRTPQPEWYIKYASLSFSYGEDAFVLYPQSIDATGEVFGLLVNSLIDDLYTLGAYDMFYGGMMD